MALTMCAPPVAPAGTEKLNENVPAAPTAAVPRDCPLAPSQKTLTGWPAASNDDPVREILVPAAPELGVACRTGQRRTRTRRLLGL